MTAELDQMLARTARLHRHLCPRQVLGVRIGLCAGRLLDIGLPQDGKRMLVIAETDGCAADGISAATGCTVGHRTLRIEDYGKLAATCVDTLTGRSFRIAPRSGIRERACRLAPPGSSRWEGYLLGYQRMAEDDLLCAEAVELVVPVERLVSRPRARAVCARCGEEVHNEREVISGGIVLCRGCAGPSYYRCPEPASREEALAHEAP